MERVSSYENEIKQLRFKISGFEIQQILYFIEVERLHMVNAEFIDDIEKAHAEIARLTEESSQHKQVLDVFLYVLREK